MCLLIGQSLVDHFRLSEWLMSGLYSIIPIHEIQAPENCTAESVWSCKMIGDSSISI